MYTGNIVRIERDENPKSPTYGTEREIVELSEICQNWQCRMVEIERETSGGVTMVTYEDKNENAPTFGKTITIAATDTTAQYLEMYSRCEQLRYHDEYYGNSGYKVATNIDANPNSNTYQQVTENVRTLDLIGCGKPNTNPIEEIETHCKLIDYASGQEGTNGVEVVEVYDMNPYSTTYLEKLREYERQSEDCKEPETAANIVKICEFCEVNAQGKETGYKITTQKDINLFSPTYNSDFHDVRVEDLDMCERVKSNYIIGAVNTPNMSVRMLVNNSYWYGTSDDDGGFEIGINEPIRFISNLTPTNIRPLLLNIDLSDLDLSNINSATYAFLKCEIMEDVILGNNKNMPNLTAIDYMFYWCLSVQSVDFSGWDLSNVTNIAGLFGYCRNMHTVNFDGCDLSKVTSSYFAFGDAGRYTGLTIFARGCNQATIDLLNKLKPSYANLIY